MATIDEIKKASALIEDGGIRAYNVASLLVGPGTAIGLLVAHSANLITRHSSPLPLELEDSVQQVLRSALPSAVYMRYLTPHYTYYIDGASVLDNCSAHIIEYEDMAASTLEHLYQALKVDDTTIQARILAARSPFKAKEIVHEPEIQPFIRPDWAEKKRAVMKRLKQLKVMQHEDVRTFLLQSVGYRLIENSPTNTYWGSGEFMNGANVDGGLWEEIRGDIVLGLY